MLSETQLARYHRDGFVVPDYRLPPALLAKMRDALKRLIATNADRTSDFLLCPHLVYDAAQEIDGMTPIRGDEEWFDFAVSDAILDMVEQVLGPHIIMWGTTVFGKPAGNGKATPWHQDGEYWPIRPLATCSVWIALDDTTPENGCLRVIPGSHREKRLRRHLRTDRQDLTLNLELQPEEFNETDAHDVCLRAGQISLHDIYLLHGSQANTSGQRRAGYVLRFMPASAHYDHALGKDMARRKHGVIDLGRRAIFLVRGRDESGRNDFEIGHVANRAAGGRRPAQGTPQSA